jgi:type II secretory pathway component GspD/PulD (secretin)
VKKSILIIAPVALALAMAMAMLPTTTPSFAQEERNIEQMIDNAKTVADYEAIARYYDQKADEAQKEFEWHEGLYQSYMQNPRLSTMQMHCDRLVHIYKDEAKEDRIMADQYRQMAKNAK